MKPVETPFENKINYDTVTEEALYQANEKLVDYLIDTNEEDAAEQVMHLMELAEKDPQVKKDKNPYTEKLYNVNSEILKTLKRIQEDMIDEQDTSIKKTSGKQKILFAGNLANTENGLPTEANDTLDGFGFGGFGGFGGPRIDINRNKVKPDVKQPTTKAEPKGTKTNPKTPPKSASKGGMKLMKGGLKAMAKVAGPLALALAAYDAYQGYKNAGENLGISEAELTTASKLSSAVGSVVSGVTLGLADEKEMSKGINNIVGGNKTIEKYDNNIIDYDIIGMSEINDWNALAKLPAKEIENIIKIDDWRKSDLKRMQELLELAKQRDKDLPKAEDATKSLNKTEVDKNKPKTDEKEADKVVEEQIKQAIVVQKKLLVQYQEQQKNAPAKDKSRFDKMIESRKIAIAELEKKVTISNIKDDEENDITDSVKSESTYSLADGKGGQFEVSKEDFDKYSSMGPTSLDDPEFDAKNNKQNQFRDELIKKYSTKNAPVAQTTKSENPANKIKPLPESDNSGKQKKDLPKDSKSANNKKDLPKDSKSANNKKDLPQNDDKQMKEIAMINEELADLKSYLHDLYRYKASFDGTKEEWKAEVENTKYIISVKRGQLIDVVNGDTNATKTVKNVSSVNKEMPKPETAVPESEFQKQVADTTTNKQAKEVKVFETAKNLSESKKSYDNMHQASAPMQTQSININNTNAVQQKPKEDARPLNIFT